LPNRNLLDKEIKNIKTMKTYFKKLILAGIAGALLAPAVQATSVNFLTVGGNASIKLIQDRLQNFFGLTLANNSTNSLIFRASGTWGGTNITWDFNFTGGAGAINDIAQGNHITRQDNSTAIPVSAISIEAPETEGIDSTPFQQDYTLVAPVVFVKNASLTGNSLAGITNLTQRQANYLEFSGGALPTAYFGGNPLSNNIPGDALYFVGRNTLAAVRKVTDAVIFETHSVINYNTNNLGQPFRRTDGGASSGTEVAAIVKAIPNSIGTVAAQDVGSLTPLSYEGVTYTPANVINGSYPLWGYERYIYYPSGNKAPTGDELYLIQALESAVEDPTFQATSVFSGKFVNYNAVNNSIGRDLTNDGGLIESNIY
jgi:hypothetical protein